MWRAENFRHAPAFGVALATIVTAGTANAAITGHRWEVIDNNTTAECDPTGIDQDTVFTFDLYLEWDGDDAICCVDSGVAPAVDPNTGLNISGGTFFQVSAIGVNNEPPSEAFLDFEPLLEFDSYVGLGTLTAEQISTQGVNFTVNGDTSLRGSWFIDPGAGLGSSVPADANNDIFAGRFSIELDAARGFEDASFGGELLVTGAGDPELLVISNAFDAIPTPGAAALFALAGMLTRSRRRA